MIGIKAFVRSEADAAVAGRTQIVSFTDEKPTAPTGQVSPSE